LLHGCSFAYRLAHAASRFLTFAQAAFKRERADFAYS
jgi:hypothetical protein